MNRCTRSRGGGRRLFHLAVNSAIASLLLLGLTTVGAAPTKGGAIRPTQTIPLPDVEGRIDHLAVDVNGKRLFVCALGNNSLEVIDLQRGERIHAITALGSPQGVAYSNESSRLYVANENGGRCNIYDGHSFAPLGVVDFKDDADNVRYDRSSKRVYVGYGEGGIGVIDAESGRNIGSLKLAQHPEAFVLEQNGPRIFVNVPTTHEVAVIDRAQGKVIATWKTDGAFANFPMALDESNHRLFLGCRLPAKLVVLNTDSGAVVATLSIAGDPDDVFYDEKNHRVYAICGAGAIEVIDQLDRDSYQMTATIKTASGARTGLFVPELSSLFVAVPHRGAQTAEIRRYTVQ